MHPSTVHTLQFPAFGNLPRKGFLAVAHRHVVTFALKRQEIIAQMGGNAGYFHSQKEHPNPVPLLIHSLQKDGMFTIRAYTQPAVDTLMIWYRLFREAEPALCTHTISTTEEFILKELESPILYRGRRWIPYRNLHVAENGYLDKDTGTPADFNSRIIGNLRTFVNNIWPENQNLNVEIALKELRPGHTPVTALIKKHETELLPITKYAFDATLAVNVELPVYFSIGQNASYGNGVFERI